MKLTITLRLTDEQRDTLAAFYAKAKRKHGGVGYLLAQPFAATETPADGTLQVNFYTQAEGGALREAFDAVRVARGKA